MCKLKIMSPNFDDSRAYMRQRYNVLCGSWATELGTLVVFIVGHCHLADI